jgi:hypothetical protein
MLKQRHFIAYCQLPIAYWDLARINPDRSNLFAAFMYLHERFFIEACDTG